MQLIYKAGVDKTEESKHQISVSAAGPSLEAPWPHSPLLSALAQRFIFGLSKNMAGHPHQGLSTMAVPGASQCNYCPLANFSEPQFPHL